MAALVPVALKRLSLTDFRNYTHATLHFSSSMVAFCGPNGSGKTNLLEAISFFSPGRGLRRCVLSDASRANGAGGWAVNCQMTGAFEETRIGTGLTLGETSRKLRIDGDEVRSSEVLLEYLRVLWLVPSMDGLFTGAASERRKFLDRLVLALHPGHGRVVSNYERALRQRNRLLFEAGGGGYLDAIEAQVAELGSALALARRETVMLLSEKLHQQCQRAGQPFPSALVSLSGEFEDETAGLNAIEVENAFKESLREGRLKDRAAGRTLVGPHRSDLIVLHLEKELPAALASTGEQKALLISLVLAHAELTSAISGMTPTLLLDEVAAHLDPIRRIALFERLQALGGQVFMSGTDASLFVDLPSCSEIIQVENARIIQ
ncbi:DNA replication/repair protein RecF [Polycladidibacter stylochi]|uniref:DNA replication/repair protein RecF n=1 Tax=Polycladidibacter stylochi TaxID=1807766 RepID=UPI00082F8850|nr:DNA replication/repair protein RecF [Pseudovibrio stylochi]